MNSAHMLKNLQTRFMNDQATRKALKPHPKNLQVKPPPIILAMRPIHGLI